MRKEDLMTVYESIGQLRDQGIKMKDIADRLDMPPSVLSAIYSTVLPAYLDNLSRQEEDAALENALSLVNNVSKKRLLSSLPDMLRQLQNYCSPVSEITLPIEKSPCRRCQAYRSGNRQLHRCLPELQPVLLFRCLENGTLPDYTFSGRAFRPGRTPECLPHPAMGDGHHQQPPELLRHVQRNRPAPTQSGHPLPAIALPGTPRHAEGTLSGIGLQPQSHRPAHRAGQTIGSSCHRRLCQPEKRHHRQRPAHPGTGGLLPIHLPTRRLYQNVYGSYPPLRRFRPGTRKEDA